MVEGEDQCPFVLQDTVALLKDSGQALQEEASIFALIGILYNLTDLGR